VVNGTFLPPRTAREDKANKILFQIRQSWNLSGSISACPVLKILEFFLT
jgi:hypothetical protein